MREESSYHRGIRKGIDLLYTKLKGTEHYSSELSIIVGELLSNISLYYDTVSERHDRQYYDTTELPEYDWVLEPLKDIRVVSGVHCRQSFRKQIEDRVPTIDEVIDFVESIRVDKDLIEGISKRLLVIHTQGLSFLLLPMNISKEGERKLLQ